MGESFKSTFVCFGLESELELGSPVRVPGRVTQNEMSSAEQRFP